MLVWLIFFNSILLRQHIRPATMEISLITCLAGLFSTHLLRNCIRRYQLTTLTLKLLLAIVTAAFIGGLLRIAGISLVAKITTLPRRFVYHNIFADTSDIPPAALIPWTTIYCLYFYTQRHRKETLEKKRFELLLKEKELSAAATGQLVDIDDLIGTLDRIRSLIDNDPAGARAGITAFSHLLRKGQLKTD